MKISDYIALFLEQNKIRQVYELTGGMITHLLDSIHQRTKIHIISMHHEQAAAFSAEGSSRMTGIPGVALATSGPGAVNLLTGIGSCFFDSVPSVFITGQVNRNEMRADRHVRQIGFQETDIVAMAKSITKGAWQALSPEEVPNILVRAFELAVADRPGPVLIDIPMDVQHADVTTPAIPIIVGAVRSAPSPLDHTLFKEMMVDLSLAKRPLILAGGGIRSACAAEPFRTFVEKLQIPVVHSLMGVDLLPYNHPLRVGMIGTYGNRWANHALCHSDHLLVLGSRLDVRQTGADTDAFCMDKTIWHVDVDIGEINNRVKKCRGFVSELRTFLRAANLQILLGDQSKLNSWRLEIENLRRKWPDTEEQPDLQGINPNILIHQLSRRFPHASAFISDVGQHQMWTGQSLELKGDQRFLTSGGMGAMGFALPAAIGAAVSFPDRPVVVIAGDGGFQCNIQELQTVVRNHLPIKIVIINNRSLGMVRQFQESYFESRFQSTVWGYSHPDFVKVAEAYGISGRRVVHPHEIDSGIDWLCSAADVPCLLDVYIDIKTNACPKTVFGLPISEMEPIKAMFINGQT